VHLVELADDLLGVAAEVRDRAADVEAQELDEQGERVCQRQEQVGALVAGDDVERLAHVQDGAVVAVAEHAALGRPGRARGVDEGERVLGRDRRGPRLELGGIARAPALADLVEGDGVRGVAVRIDDDQRAQLRQPVADGDDLGDLPGVLADDRHRVRVAHHPLALLGRVGRVDRHDDRAGARDGEVAVRPLRARVAQDADALAGLHAQVDEAEADLAHDLADLREGHVVPFAVGLVAHGDAVGELLCRTTNEVGDRLRSRRMRGGGAGLHRSPPTDAYWRGDCMRVARSGATGCLECAATR
jgi:hypothetical protein